MQLEARLIDDLLDLTRISTGKIDLHEQRVDGHSLARDALGIAKSDIHRKGLNVTTDWGAKDHYIWGDPVRIEQVFWNLINNAVKFTGTSGEIRIQTWNENGNFHFAITDTGIGALHRTNRNRSLPHSNKASAVRRGALAASVWVWRSAKTLSRCMGARFAL